jgi:hypothetical protein
MRIRKREGNGRGVDRVQSACHVFEGDKKIRGGLRRDRGLRQSAVVSIINGTVHNGHAAVFPFISLQQLLLSLSTQ